MGQRHFSKAPTENGRCFRTLAHADSQLQMWHAANIMYTFLSAELTSRRNSVGEDKADRTGGGAGLEILFLVLIKG